LGRVAEGNKLTMRRGATQALNWYRTGWIIRREMEMEMDRRRIIPPD